MRPRLFALAALLVLAGSAGVASSASGESVYRNCGEGSTQYFGEIQAGPIDVVTRNVRCRTGIRFANRLFFGQACIFCDGGYTYGWMRFRGFDCHVGPGRGDSSVQFFRCYRGERRVSFNTQAIFPVPSS